MSGNLCLTQGSRSSQHGWTSVHYTGKIELALAVNLCSFYKQDRCWSWLYGWTCGHTQESRLSWQSYRSYPNSSTLLSCYSNQYFEAFQEKLWGFKKKKKCTVILFYLCTPAECYAQNWTTEQLNNKAC